MVDEGDAYASWEAWPNAHPASDTRFKYEAIGENSLPCSHYRRGDRIYKRQPRGDVVLMREKFGKEYKEPPKGGFDFYTHTDPVGNQHKWTHV